MGKDEIKKRIAGKVLPAEILLDRIEMYREKLSEAKLSDVKYKAMLTALFGVKLIIGDLLIDPD